MITKITWQDKDEYTLHEGVGIFADDGETQISHGVASMLQSRYCGNYIPTQAIGGIGTEPEYRRNGCVREFFKCAFELGAEHGSYVSMLHPFSFSYYRKFGYEKISDHCIMEFPMSALDFLPRCNNLVKLTEDKRIPDVLAVYEKFSENRNIMFRRFDSRHYSLNPKESKRYTYIWYGNDGSPEGYITLMRENVYYVNRMKSIALHVYEMAFLNPEALYALLGFLRMYEGEMDNIIIHDYGMFPELDFVLRHYTHTKYSKISDIAARIQDVSGMLKANKYPRDKGHFVLRVEDELPACYPCNTRGTYEVDYDDGKLIEAAKIADTENFDVKADISSLARIFYGYEAYTSENAVYLPNVEVKNNSDDFFKAFPKRMNGLFEHF